MDQETRRSIHECLSILEDINGLQEDEKEYTEEAKRLLCELLESDKPEELDFDEQVFPTPEQAKKEPEREDRLL